MAKLYPPYLEGTLPAFSLNTEGDGKMTIPFSFNRAVNINAIKSLAIKIKTVQNDILMGDVTLAKNNGVWDEIQSVAIFQIKNNKINGTNIDINIGQFYKVQLAFIDNNDIIGYYSTVGVIKCTSVPAEVSIMNFSTSRVNNNNTEFIGIFRQAEGGDISEKVYSSKFTIIDIDGNIVETTGDVLHNIENNPNSYSSEDKMIFNRDLDENKLYKITYEVTTTNGLVVSSPAYLLTQQITLDIDNNINIEPTLYKDDGYISIQLLIDNIVNGTFVLAREDQLNPGYWNELHRFALKNQSIDLEIFKDFTIEQGKTYVYSLQQYNNYNVYSNRKLTDPIYADFDDMFLYDGKRQLKLCFNPQVSSFKTQLAESRLETIGSKYPFFYRNARIEYKTFPISGLISMLSDDNQFFVTYEDILRRDDLMDRHLTNAGVGINKNGKNNFYNNHDNGIIESNNLNTEENNWESHEEKYRHNALRNLINTNFVSERLFKLSVLDWLNNGRVKLFKSPGEGNYLVRLMDTSLAPNTTLGRMLHTVTSTAYECAELNHENCIKYEILQDLSYEDASAISKVVQWKTINIDDDNKNNNLLVNSDGRIKTSILRFIDFLPGTRIKIVMDPSGDRDSENSVIITIGSTGDYYANDIETVYGIYIMDNEYVPGSSTILCQYEDSVKSKFEAITKTITDVSAYKQFVGPINNVLKDNYPLKEHITKVNLGDFKKRPVQYLYYNESSVTPEEGDIYLNNETIRGFRTLNLNYFNKLYWVAGMDKTVRLYAKKKNTNGLPETWWDVQDWARYYAIVSLIADGKDPDDYTDEQLKEFYPKKLLYNYKKSGTQFWTTSQIETALEYPQRTFYSTHQMIYQYEDGTWGSHGPSCSHFYYQLNPVDSRCVLGTGVVGAYVYLPTFPGEFEYDYDNNSDFVFIDLSAYGKIEEVFDDKENMEYSPFSLYVLRSNQLTIDGVKRDIVKHVSADPSHEQTLHIADHLFEKYYIDRYLSAVTAEEALTERILLENRLVTEDEEEDYIEAIEEATSMYVLDPWYGKIYKVDSSFDYSPCITIDGQNIDLNEIERYRIDNFRNNNSTIKIGNGVYGELFIQNLITYYSFESNEDTWDDFMTSVVREGMETKEYEEAVEQVDQDKKAYHEMVEAQLEEWTARID